MITLFRTIMGLIYRSAYNAVIKHDGIEHAGYLTFLALLALFPFLVLIVSLAGFFGQGALGTGFVELMFTNLPAEAVSALRPRVAEIISGPPQGFLTVAILGAIWTSSSMVEGMRTVLNKAYHVHTPPAYWFRRLLSILQVLIIIGIILIVMTVFVFTPFLISKLQAIFALTLSYDHHAGWERFIFLISAGTLFLMVSYLYFVLP
ncbi:MAG: YihY/virulence factor BrkB family protein, partial [Rickettsiales bacterium]|nr:YihY/virulence factor BrkB family protein [Rickettsiales bacterium]